ncbi:MAG: hypothetical protein ACFCD0_16325 [Gemmataceae bacterium]
MRETKKKRSGLVTFLAIMNIVIGAIWGLCLTCSGGLVVANQAATQELNAKMAEAQEEAEQVPRAEDEGAKQEPLDPKAEQEAKGKWALWLLNIVSTNSPRIGEVLVSYLVVQILLSWGLVVAGVGLLLVKKWGRMLTWVYVVLSLVSLILLVVYGMTGFAENMPKKEVTDWVRAGQQKQYVDKDQADAFVESLQENGPGAYYSSIIQSALVWGSYSLLVLVFLCLPPFNKAFASSDSGKPPPHQPPEEDDWGNFGNGLDSGGPRDRGPGSGSERY